jgi:group I intron endonuclease
MIGIYKITNPKGKIYVGKSKNIELRFNQYYKIQCCKQQRKLYNSLCKYNPKHHNFDILEECSLDVINEREIFWIKKLNSIKNGLNLTKGGDGGELADESKELRRLNSMKPILQYSLDGEFIKEYPGASEAIKHINKGNANNINDCARGKYKSTYGFQWMYKNDDYFPLNIGKYNDNRGNKNPWNDVRRNKTKNSRKGEKRSSLYSKKIKWIKTKIIYQYNINNKLNGVFFSFGEFNGSGIIGTKKLRKIINKNIYHNGYRYTYKLYIPPNI